MCSGRLSMPRRSPSSRRLKPNFVAMTHLIAERRQRLADQLLVRERTVGLRGVEERDAALEGGADQRDHLPAFSVAGP